MRSTHPLSLSLVDPPEIADYPVGRTGSQPQFWWGALARQVPLEIWILTALALLVVLARLATGQPQAMLGLAVALPLLAGALLYWLVAALARIEARRELSAYELPYGATLRQTLTLAPRSRPALWLLHWSAPQVRDRSTVPGLPAAGIAVSVAGGIGGEVEDEREALVFARGVWQQGPTELIISAPAGLVRYTRPIAPGVQVVVYPPVVRLAQRARETGQRDRQHVRLLSAQIPRAPRRPPTVVGQRPYQPGDPLAWVNRAARGPHGERYTRQFAHVVQRDLLLIVDPDPATTDPLLAQQRLDTLAAAAATLAHHALASSMPSRSSSTVTLVTATMAAAGASTPGRADVAGETRVAHSLDGLPALLRTLAKVAPLASETAQRALDRALGVALFGKETVVVLTCGSSVAWRERVTQLSGRQAGSKRRVHLVIAGRSPDAASEEIAPGEALRLGDDWALPAYLSLLAAALQRLA